MVSVLLPLISHYASLSSKKNECNQGPCNQGPREAHNHALSKKRKQKEKWNRVKIKK